MPLNSRQMVSYGQNGWPDLLENYLLQNYRPCCDRVLFFFKFASDFLYQSQKVFINARDDTVAACAIDGSRQWMKPGNDNEGPIG